MNNLQGFQYYWVFGQSQSIRGDNCSAPTLSIMQECVKQINLREMRIKDKKFWWDYPRGGSTASFRVELDLVHNSVFDTEGYSHLQKAARLLLNKIKYIHVGTVPLTVCYNFSELEQIPGLLYR